MLNISNGFSWDKLKNYNSQIKVITTQIDLPNNLLVEHLIIMILKN